jgi:proline iminopeptidase
MKVRPLIVGLAAMFLATVLPYEAGAQTTGTSQEARETRVPVPGASLYARTIGQGRPMIVLHGGPDFDQAYLLPDLDRLKDVFQLIYYDQRGRGRSADNVQPPDVTLSSDIEDIDRVRRHFRLDAPVILGHSWGTVLALEYARRYPTRVSHLVLMNPAPVSAKDFALLREAYLRKLGAPGRPFDLGGRHRWPLSHHAEWGG